MYHYCMPFEDVSYGVLVPDPARSDPDCRKAHEWLAAELGFWPVFIAVGDSLESYWMTGYHDNWGRVVSRSAEGTVLRKAGESPNHVLFSFEQLSGVFMDYGLWFLVINAQDIEKEIGLVQRRWIFKPAWSVAKWLRRSLDPKRGNVMLVSPQLDLRAAKRVWVRNRQTKRALGRLGFLGVEVHRIPVPGL
jgi:hypothetical protein